MRGCVAGSVRLRATALDCEAASVGRDGRLPISEAAGAAACVRRHRQRLAPLAVPADFNCLCSLVGIASCGAATPAAPLQQALRPTHASLQRQADAAGIGQVPAIMHCPVR